MKKVIRVVALDPFAAESYKKDIESLFGNYAEIVNYSVLDGTATGKLPRADLFVISTDAYGSAEEVARHVPIDCDVMSIEVSFTWNTLERLWEIPKGEKVLFVNMTQTMAREAIAQLASLGVNHVQFIPFYPGAVMEEPITMAVTPAEMRYVPKTVETVIDIGQRSCTSGMMIEIALRLGLEHLLETEPFQAYFQSIATQNYSFDQIFARSKNLESRFHILMEILDEGLIGVNEKGEIFACNKKACQITKVAEELTMGKRGEDVFPYIPFYQVLKEKKEVQAHVIKLFGVNISIAVVPVLRRQECIGAFATLQRFNELESKQNELRKQLLQKGHYAKYTFDDVIGESDAICQTKEILKKMAVTESPVLIVGETGTGKELMAHAVHQASRRSDGPFIAINVAAMPENLLESELFGYEEGAFTGAKKGGRPGLFEFAHHGTLFLDEVEGMSFAMQVKLLRVLQEGEVMRVGGSGIVRVDVRIVAATNESLEKKVEDGSFRKDLYYRLNALTVVLPPLRERGEDVLLLLEQFKRELNGTFQLSERTKQFLLEYSWPGNIRELHNTAEYFNYTGKQVVELEDLPPTMARMRFIGNAGMSALCKKKEDAVELEKKEPAEAIYNSSQSRIEAWSGKETEPYWFVMENLYLAAEQGQFIGREKLHQIARERRLPISQKCIRDILHKMTDQGYIVSGRGRGGSRITSEGRECWLHYQKGNL
ncbi:MAG: sigma-54 interaction domain-containing protein [Brotaphodocola sp.]